MSNFWKRTEQTPLRLSSVRAVEEIANAAIKKKKKERNVIKQIQCTKK